MTSNNEAVEWLDDWLEDWINEPGFRPGGVIVRPMFELIDDHVASPCWFCEFSTVPHGVIVPEVAEGE